MKKIKHIITSAPSRMYLYAAALVIVSITVGVTLAYLAANSAKTNTIVIDKGDISINESFSKPESLSLDNKTQKVVKVHNSANTDCYVRVFVDFSDSEVGKRSLVSNDDQNYISWEEFTSTTVPQTIAPNWVYVNDAGSPLRGYFYYTQKVAAGDYTPPLFSWVETRFDKQTASGPDESYLTAASSDLITDFEIIVYSESVQTVDLGNELDNYSDAWTYFLTKNRPAAAP